MTETAPTSCHDLLKLTILALLRITLVCSLCISFTFTGLQAQDQIYTQYRSVPLYYNPALTGADAGIHTHSIGRLLHWINTPLKSKSFSFSGDFGQRKIPGIGGIGILVNGEQVNGMMKDLQVGLSLSARIKFTPGIYMQAGIIGSVIKRKINLDELVFTSQLDPYYGNVYPQLQPPSHDKITVADFGAGLLFQFTDRSGMFANTTGMAVNHIFEPDVSFYESYSSPYPRKWVAHSDFLITTRECSTCALKLAGFADPLQINPGILYQNQHGINTIQAGTDIIKFNFVFGLWYRYTSYPINVISVKAGYRYAFTKDMFIRLLYSIDLTGSSHTSSSAMVHELSLDLSFGKLHK